MSDSTKPCSPEQQTTEWEREHVLPMRRLIEYFLAWTKQHDIQPTAQVYRLRKGWVLCDALWYEPESGLIQRSLLIVLPNGTIVTAGDKARTLRIGNHYALGKLHERDESYQSILATIRHIATQADIVWISPAEEGK